MLAMDGCFPLVPNLIEKKNDHLGGRSIVSTQQLSVRGLVDPQSALGTYHGMATLINSGNPSSVPRW